MRFGKVRLLLFSGVVASLIVAACGGGGGGDEEEAAPAAPAAPTATPTRAPATAPTAIVAPRPTAVPAATVAPTATARPVPRGELRYALNEMGTFKGFQDQGVTNIYLDAAYDYMIGSTPDGIDDPTSGIISQWTVSADGKVWTLKTRDGIKFHNGDAATAKDVAFWLNYGISDDSRFSSKGAHIRDVQSFTAPDNNTAVVTLRSPNVFWPQTQISKAGCGGSPCQLVPEKYFTSVGTGGFNKTPVSSGPYKITNIQIGASMTMEAVDNHWFFGTPRFKTLYWQLVPEEITRLALLKNRDIEATNISRDGAVQLKNTRGVKTFNRDGSGTVNIRLENQWVTEYPGYGKNPLSVLAVRQALVLHAIDRDTLASTFLKGFATSTVNYPVTVADVAYEKLPLPKFDPAKAKQMIADAGWAKGFELDFFIWPRPALPEGEEMAESIAQGWEKIGVKVNRRNMSYDSWKDNWLFPAKWTRPSVSGLWYLANNRISASLGQSVNNKASQYSQSYSQDTIDLGQKWFNAKTPEEYKKLGLEFTRHVANNLEMQPALFDVGVLVATVDDPKLIPADWKIAAFPYSLGLELIAVNNVWKK
ncbi:MAG: ABC transporter substrate-binding protein [Dehalococcoidia bacterium]|nr:ABC transporter substrate-binding protein [Dehalococcoidia bacterium]